MEDAYPHGNHATANNNYHLFISSLLTTRPLTSLPPQPVNDGHSWQHRLNEFLHAPILDLILHVLLIIDIICVIVAMQLSTLYLDSKVKDLERALEAADHADGDDDYRRLSGEENSEHKEYGNESFERGEHGVVGALDTDALERIGLEAGAPEHGVHPQPVVRVRRAGQRLLNTESGSGPCSRLHMDAHPFDVPHGQGVHADEVAGFHSSTTGRRQRPRSRERARPRGLARLNQGFES